MHKQLGGIGLQGVVGIDKLQVFAVRLAQTQIAGGCHAAVGFVDQHNALVHPGIHFAYLQADVLAAVVEQDDLQIFVGLAANTLDTACNMVLRVVDGYNDADQRLFTHRATS